MTAPDAAAFAFGSSFRFDRRLFEDDATGSIAWARALARAGVLPPDEAGQIEAALTDILERGRTDPGLRGRPRRGRPQLRRAAARRAARRRRPASAHRPLAQRTGLAGSPALSAAPHSAAAARRSRPASAALAGQAEAAGDALMPSFTHLRPAQPILVAHFFLAHVAALRRDHERLRGARAEADALPLGSGADCRHQLRDRRRRCWRAIWASPASSPTASTPRRIATLRPRSSTRAR